jgi:hypothetical protein
MGGTRPLAAALEVVIAAPVDDDVDVAVGLMAALRVGSAV